MENNMRIMPLKVLDVSRLLMVVVNVNIEEERFRNGSWVLGVNHGIILIIWFVGQRLPESSLSLGINTLSLSVDTVFTYQLQNWKAKQQSLGDCSTIATTTLWKAPSCYSTSTTHASTSFLVVFSCAFHSPLIPSLPGVKNCFWQSSTISPMTDSLRAGTDRPPRLVLPSRWNTK